MLEKIFKEIGRFVLVGILYCLYCIVCLCFEFNNLLPIILILIPILIALCLWKRSKMWLIDLIMIIILGCMYVYSTWMTVFPTIS